MGFASDERQHDLDIDDEVRRIDKHGDRSVGTVGAALAGRKTPKHKMTADGRVGNRLVFHRDGRDEALGSGHLALGAFWEILRRLEAKGEGRSEVEQRIWDRYRLSFFGYKLKLEALKKSVEKGGEAFEEASRDFTEFTNGMIELITSKVHREEIDEYEPLRDLLREIDFHFVMAIRHSDHLADMNADREPDERVGDSFDEASKEAAVGYALQGGRLGGYARRV